MDEALRQASAHAAGGGLLGVGGTAALCARSDGVRHRVGRAARQDAHPVERGHGAGSRRTEPVIVGVGVIFDVGHGGGSFLFRQVVPAVRQGWVPDSISTDLHIGSMNGGMKDMLNLMSKFLNMGVAVTDVIRESTSNPAKEI